MRRIEFLKQLLFGVAGLSVPGLTIAANPQPKNNTIAPAQIKYVRLINFYIAGYQYHQGDKIEHLLKSHEMVEMRREPHNIHDYKAIALYFDNTKIGYVPAADNEILAKMLDNNILLQARIASVAPASPAWQRVELDVLCGTGTNNALLPAQDIAHNNTRQNAN
jgi:hypothetical protein